MPLTNKDTQHWAMVGLVTGAEVYGALPAAAGGQLTDYLNGDLSAVLPLTRARTEDIAGGADVPELAVLRRHITYVQPWPSTGLFVAPPAPRGATPVDVVFVLRTRISIAGTAYFPPGMDLAGLLARSNEVFLGFGRAMLNTPNAEARPADGLQVNKEHIMLARRLNR